MELLPGADVAISVIPPIPTVWWLRPLSNAARVGEQSAVVWNRVYLSPFPASRSAFGVLIGPPKALEAPNPTSSRRTIRTFGAFSGARTGAIGANLLSGSLASYVIRPACGWSGTGSTSRFAESATVLLLFHTSADWEMSTPSHVRAAARIARSGRMRMQLQVRALPQSEGASTAWPRTSGGQQLGLRGLELLL